MNYSERISQLKLDIVHNDKMPKREAVVIIIYKDNQSILLQLRDSFPSIILPGHWGAFGGTVETGEVILDSVYRELREEL